MAPSHGLGCLRITTDATRGGPYLSADGRQIGFWSDRELQLYDSQTGKKVRGLPRAVGLSAYRGELDMQCFAFAPTGNLAVSADHWTKGLDFWDLTMRKRIRHIKTAHSVQGDIRFSGDGTLLVSTPSRFREADDVLQTFDVADEMHLATIPLPQHTSFGLAVNRDGTQLAWWATTEYAVADAEYLVPASTVILWDGRTGKERRRIACGIDAVIAAALSPDGNILAVSDAGAAIQVRDTQNGKLLYTAQGRSEMGRFLAFSPDGKTLAAAAPDGQVQRWNVASGRRLDTPDGPKAVVLSMSFDGDGRLLLCGMIGRTVVAWEGATGTVLTPNQEDRGGVTGLAFAADSHTLYVVDESGGLVRWDVQDRREMSVLTRRPSHEAPADERQFSPDPQYWEFAPSATSVIRQGHNLIPLMHALPGGEEMMRLPDDWAYPGSYSPDGKLVALFDREEKSGTTARLNIWDVRAGRRIAHLESPEIPPDVMWLRFKPDCRSLLLGTWTSTPASETATAEVFLCDFRAGKVRPLYQMKFGAGNPPVFAWLPDGSIFAVGQVAAPVMLCDGATGHLLCHLEAPLGCDRLLFSPDGRTLAGAFTEYAQAYVLGEVPGRVVLWEVATGQIRRQFSGHVGVGNALAMAFSPDGKLLATGSKDTTVILWDVTGTATEPAPVRRSEGGATETLGWFGRKCPASRCGARELVCSPADTVALFRKHLRPEPDDLLDDAGLQRCIAALDDDSYDVREAAAASLLRQGVSAVAPVRLARLAHPSPEARRSQTLLLEALESPSPRPEQIRPLRAVEALERIGTPEARRLLAELAQGRADALLNRSAQAALKRLGSSAALLTTEGAEERRGKKE